MAHKEVDHDSHSAFNVCAHVSAWGCILRACCTHSVLSFTGSEQTLPYTAHSGAATDIGDVSCRLAALTVCCLLQAVNSPYPTQPIVEQLQTLGMCPTGLPLPVAMSQCYSVLLDGRLVGYLPDNIVVEAANQLRALKVMGLQQVSESRVLVFLAVCLCHVCLCFWLSVSVTFTCVSGCLSLSHVLVFLAACTSCCCYCVYPPPPQC